MILKTYRLLLFINLLIVCQATFSQNIKGTVISKNEQPIPFATIEINKKYGCITNEEGNFSIDISTFKPQDSVIISCLGFNKHKTVIKQFTSTKYYLEEYIDELSEVILTNKTLSTDSLLFYVKKNLTKNYNLQSINLTVFSRKTEHINGKDANFRIKKSTGFNKQQLQLFNDDFDKLEKSLLNNKSKQYTDIFGELMILNEEKSKLSVDKAIRLLDENNNQSLESLFKKGNDIVLKHLSKSKVYTVKSGFFKISDSASLTMNQSKMKDTINSLAHVRKVTHSILKKHNPITPKSKLDFITTQKNYNYIIEDITVLDNEMVYKVSFTPKKYSAKYSGTLYISSDTFAIIQVNYQHYSDKIEKKINLKFLLGLKYIERNKRVFIKYKKNEDGFYYPNYINDKIERYFYIDRPIKFIENESPKRKVTFSFFIEGIYKEKTELLSVSIKGLNKSNYKNYNEKNKIDYETPKIYDISIWKDYNILEPLNDMKSFNTTVK